VSLPERRAQEARMNLPTNPSRRDVLRLAGALLVGGASAAASLCCDNPAGGSAVGGKSKLVISRDAKLRPSKASVDPTRLLNVLDRAMQAVYDSDSPLEAWKKVARPGETVGLKVNCLAGKGNATRAELVDAICERLQQVGVRDIIIWDRLNADLESARFRIVERGSGIRCFGNDVLGYESELATFGSVGSLLSRILTQACDAVINLPVLKDHGIAGVTIALKSMFGAIHNPNKYHLNAGDPYVADVFMLPPIRQKVRLHICDATTAQYEGGPSYMPQWTWPYNGLLVSRDPVALDYTGWQIIEKKRAAMGMKSLRELKREPTYIATAADSRHRLGTNDANRLEVVEIG
jgi:uncharacterized protein (DUF362 family)